MYKALFTLYTHTQFFAFGVSRDDGVSRARVLALTSSGVRGETSVGGQSRCRNRDTSDKDASDRILVARLETKLVLALVVNVTLNMAV